MVVFSLIAVLLGGLHAWLQRFTMNVDGICYLDMGDAWWRGDWGMIANAYWSPLYPCFLGLVVRILKPSPFWEFPLAHLVNFLVFVFALGSFGFMVSELLRFNRDRQLTLSTERLVPLPEGLWLTCAYLLFFWSSLRMMLTTPDMTVAAFIYLICGILLRIRNGAFGRRTFVVLGIVLGLGYLAKAPLFPMAFVFLACAVTTAAGRRQSLSHVGLSLGVFLLVAGPWIGLLSKTQGRLTFGDSGRLNHAWTVNGLRKYVHWQGGPPGCGMPKHPTRQVLDSPAVYEFAAPIGGTYPPWYDPSYWHDGVRNHFEPAGQIAAIRRTAEAYFRIFYHWQGGLIVAVVGLYLLGSRGTIRWRHLAGYAFLLVPVVIGLLMYVPLHVSFRYVGSMIVVLWLVLLSGVVLPDSPWMRKAALCLTSAAMANLGLLIVYWCVTPTGDGAGDYTGLRDYGRPHTQWHIADRLNRMGIGPGTQIAFIGEPLFAYWARLARVRIVADVPARFGDAALFRTTYPFVKDKVFAALENTPAQFVVVERPPPSVAAAGWRRIGDSELYVRPLGDR